MVIPIVENCPLHQVASLSHRSVDSDSVSIPAAYPMNKLMLPYCDCEREVRVTSVSGAKFEDEKGSEGRE